MNTNGTIVVSGAPGSGKTTLCAQLARLTGLPVSITPGGPDAARRIDMLRLEHALPDCPPAEAIPDGPAIIEQSAYGLGFSGPAELHILVVDAVAVSASLKSGNGDDPRLFGDADLVVVTKGDLIDDEGVLNRTRAATGAPVMSARHGKLPEDALPPVNRRELRLPDNPARPFWSYSGAASFSDRIAERFLVQRPSGIQRLKGRVISGEGGLDLDLSGRARSVTPCPAPAETVLFATGNPPDFRESELVRHFAETAASEAAGRKLFGWR